jgi:hypothetical protein
MHRLLALLALLTTSLTPVAALHCEMGAAAAEHADPDQAQHHGAPAAHHAHAVPEAAARSPVALDDADPRAAPDVPDPHPDCRLVMACGMSMLRSVHPATDRTPLPTAPGPEQRPTLALTVATPPADPPPPRRSV